MLTSDFFCWYYRKVKLRENTSIVVVVTLEVVTADKKSQFVGKKTCWRSTIYISLTSNFCIDIVHEDRARIPTQLTRHSNIFTRVFLASSTRQLHPTTPSLFYSHSPSLRLLPPPLSSLSPPLFLLFPFSLLSSFFLFFLFFLFLSFLSSLFFFFSYSFFSFLSFIFLSFFSFPFLFYFLSLSLSFFPSPFSLFSRRQRNFTDNILTGGGGGGGSHPHTPPFWDDPGCKPSRDS